MSDTYHTHTAQDAPTHILSVRHSGPRRSPSHRRRSRCGRARSSVPTSGSTSTTFGRRTRRAAPWGDGRAAGWRVHLNTWRARVTADSIRTSICGALSLPWCHRWCHRSRVCARACVRAPRGEALCVFLRAARRVCVLPLESGSASSLLSEESRFYLEIPGKARGVHASETFMSDECGRA